LPTLKYALLIEMEQMVASDSQSSMKPNCTLYSTVVNADALSKTEPLKAHKQFSPIENAQ
jgi:hypothetical protein